MRHDVAVLASERLDLRVARRQGIQDLPNGVERTDFVFAPALLARNVVLDPIYIV